MCKISKLLIQLHSYLDHFPLTCTRMLWTVDVRFGVSSIVILELWIGTQKIILIESRVAYLIPEALPAHSTYYILCVCQLFLYYSRHKMWTLEVHITVERETFKGSNFCGFHGQSTNRKKLNLQLEISMIAQCIIGINAYVRESNIEPRN